MPIPLVPIPPVPIPPVSIPAVGAMPTTRGPRYWGCCMWFLPIVIIATTVLLSIPCGLYLAWIMDGRYRAPRWLKWIEGQLNTGPQRWTQYVASLLLFNALLFIFGFVVLALQPLLPFAPAGKGMLAPTTIFKTAISFFTNTNLQHYAGEQHLSYTSQLLYVVTNM